MSTITFSFEKWCQLCDVLQIMPDTDTPDSRMDEAIYKAECLFRTARDYGQEAAALRRKLQREKDQRIRRRR